MGQTWITYDGMVQVEVNDRLICIQADYSFT